MDANTEFAMRANGLGSIADEVRQLRRFRDFVVMWTHRGPPHGGPGQEAQIVDAIKFHPVVQAAVNQTK